MDNGTQPPVAAGTSALAPVPSPPDFLPVPGKPERAWPAWKRAFLMFLEAFGLDSFAPSRKKAILFSMLGAEGQRIVDAFQLDETPASQEGDVFEVFLSAIEKHFEFSRCIALERQKLRARVQRPGETVSEYLTALRRQGSFCSYGDALEERLAEVFLEGLDSKRVQDRILRECVGTGVPTLTRVAQLALQYEQLARTTESFHLRAPSASGAAPAAVERVFAHVPIGTPDVQDGGPWPAPSRSRWQDGRSGVTSSHVPRTLQHHPP
ncbi:uncharacterized protein LOC120837073 [Ixodes scapularis]|uniref:uncharacterized protein LOC120837073 n=1 Tax=Ixodes scapularis TaxID=6945 RepID=UPI001C39245E|nr:uncharacterized protein LOC120837073 [Ixodes scapularis]